MDYFIIGLIAVAAILALRYIIKNKKNGKGCSGCSQNGICNGHCSFPTSQGCPKNDDRKK